MTPAGRSPPDDPQDRRPYVAAPFVIVRTPVLAAAGAAWPWSPQGVPCAAVPITPGASTRLAASGAGGVVRRTRIDLHVLSALCATLRASSIRGALRVRRGDGVFLARGGLAVVEGIWRRGAREDVLQLVDPDERWPGILEALGEAGSRDEVARRLAARDPALGAAEARDRVDDLVDAGIAVPDLEPTATGAEALSAVIEALRIAGAAPTASALDDLAAACGRLDTEEADPSADGEHAIASALRALGLDEVSSSVLHVALIGPSSATAGPRTARDAEDAAALLAATTPATPGELVQSFMGWFAERHGAQGGDTASLRWVPLVDALLDGPLTSGSTEPAPLLDGLELPAARAEPAAVPFGARERLLLQAIGCALQHGRRVWELDDDDLAILAGGGGAPATEGVAVSLTLVDAADGAVDEDPPVVVESVAGPSGVQGLAPLAADDPEVCRLVEQQLRAEEALLAGAVVAEIVHLPATRTPAVAERVILRTHEIPVLGRSGAPAERQLPLDDLDVTVSGRRVLLRSRRLGREVLLRHAGPDPGAAPPIVRFLLELAAGPQLGWSWGPLAASPFLPRVSRGRLVLARARWTLSRADRDRLGVTDPAERRRAARELRERLALPRWVAIRVSDGAPLILDLAHPAGLDLLAATSRERDSTVVEEVIAAPDHAEAPPAVHGVLVPLIGTRRRPAATLARDPGGGFDAPRRTFAPGSSWLHANLYLAPDAMVEVLGDVVGPALAAGRRAGVVNGWFFVRYADPHPHLRARFHGDPAGLAAVVLPALHAGVAPRLARGAPWRVQLDTYEREIERYGGPHGIELAEAIFEADSDAALAVLLAPASAGRPVWPLAVVGASTLLDDLGLQGAERALLLRTLRAEWAAEHQVDAAVEARLAARYHAERGALEELLRAPGPDDGAAPFAARSLRIRPLAAELDARARAGRLTGSRHALAASLLHMHLNRLLGAPQRPQELVVLDLLWRLAEARGGGG